MKKTSHKIETSRDLLAIIIDFTVKVFFISLLFFILIAVFSFNNKSKTNDQVEIIPLEKALKDKIVTGTFVSNGTYSGKSLLCNFKNLTGRAIKISIPAGTYFQAPDSKEQDLIIPQEEFFAMAANQEKKGILNGYCCNLSNHAPKKEGKFKLINTKAPKEMPKLLAFLKGKKFENHTLQDAIWSLTNQSSVSNVYGADEKACASLRKELFAITGQKENWYCSPQQTSMNEDRSINRETVSISGELSYVCKKGSKVHTEVISPEGEMKISTNDNTMTISGELSYNFALEVQGWKKGNYQVKVIEDSKVIKVYDFIV